MNNHLQNPPPSMGGVTFKLNTATYNLTHAYGHLDLRKIIDKKISDKRELSSKEEVEVWKYLATAERCTPQEARRAYEDALQTHA